MKNDLKNRWSLKNKVQLTPLLASRGGNSVKDLAMDDSIS